MACEGSTTFENKIEAQCEVKHTGNTLGFFGATPVTQPSALTAADNGTVNTLLFTTATANIIINMRTRINELEAKLQSLGLLD